MLCGPNARQLCLPVSCANALLFSAGQIMLLYSPHSTSRIIRQGGLTFPKTAAPY